jgi:hypothetical protein
MKSGASELLFFYTECTKTHLQALTGKKNFSGGSAPGPPTIRGRDKGRGKGQGDGKGREGGKRAQGGREGKELGLQPPQVSNPVHAPVKFRVQML